MSSSNYIVTQLKVPKKVSPDTPECSVFSPTSTQHSLQSPSQPNQHPTVTIESNLFTFQKNFLSDQYIPKKGSSIDATNDPAYQELVSRMAHHHNCSKDHITFGYFHRDQKSHSYYTPLDYFGFKIKGKTTGYGCLFYHETQKIYFLGTFKEDKIDCTDVKLFFPDGQIYFKGSLVDGLKEGYGRLYSNMG